MAKQRQGQVGLSVTALGALGALALPGQAAAELNGTEVFGCVFIDAGNCATDNLFDPDTAIVNYPTLPPDDPEFRNGTAVQNGMIYTAEILVDINNPLFTDPSIEFFATVTPPIQPIDLTFFIDSLEWDDDPAAGFISDIELTVLDQSGPVGSIVASHGEYSVTLEASDLGDRGIFSALVQIVPSHH